MSVVKTEECNAVVKSEELFGTAEDVTVQARFHTNRCNCNGIWLSLKRTCTEIALTGTTNEQNYNQRREIKFVTILYKV